MRVEIYFELFSRRLKMTGNVKNKPKNSAEKPETARAIVKLFSPFNRIANWFGAVYAAHEARLIALRVYDRRR